MPNVSVSGTLQNPCRRDVFPVDELVLAGRIGWAVERHRERGFADVFDLDQMALLLSLRVSTELGAPLGTRSFSTSKVRAPTWAGIRASHGDARSVVCASDSPCAQRAC